MTDNFPQCLQFVLNEEGGYVNDSADPGGETKFGISKRAFPELNIAALTVEGASGIYRGHYWNPCHCDNFPAPIALCVFDMAVNSGNERALRMLQEALNIQDDGVVGSQTIAAANNASLPDAVAAFTSLREAYYKSLSNFYRYGHGWINRSEACKNLALSWITKAGSNDAATT